MRTTGESLRTIFPSPFAGGRDKRRLALGIAFGLLAVASPVLAQVTTNVQGTVSQEAFRSRWVGPQADDLVSRAQGLDPGLMEAESQFEEWLREGLYVGPVRVSPGVAFGWEYSDQQNGGTATDPSDNSSLFIAPTLALLYDREIGPWSVRAAYGGGYRYYFNPDYTAGGGGGQRNPLSQSASLAIGHLGARHSANLLASGSYGIGEDVNTGDNFIQTNLNIGGNWQYVLTAFSNVGLQAAYGVSINDGAGGGTQNSDITSYNFGSYVDWLTTGKLRLRWNVGAGGASQDIEGSGDVQRRFLQSLISANYVVTEKLVVDVGLGLAYLEDQGINAPKFVGTRAVYNVSVSYEPTEKTAIQANIGLEGADIRPDAGLSIFWNPRVNTRLSLSVYQNQNFSLTSSQVVQVNRGFTAGVTQRIFSKVDLSLSGGYQETENVSLSNDVSNGADQSYGFGSLSIRWGLNKWSSFQSSLWMSTGPTNAGSSDNSPETRATVSFNLTF